MRVAQTLLKSNAIFQIISMRETFRPVNGVANVFAGVEATVEGLGGGGHGGDAISVKISFAKAVVDTRFPLMISRFVSKFVIVSKAVLPCLHMFAEVETEPKARMSDAASSSGGLIVAVNKMYVWQICALRRVGSRIFEIRPIGYTHLSNTNLCQTN